jgi:hypothetical protein
MLPSRQVLGWHRSPGCLNTSTEAAEVHRPKLPLKSKGSTKGVNTMGGRVFAIQFRLHVRHWDLRERLNRLWDATLLCFTRTTGQTSRTFRESRRYGRGVWWRGFDTVYRRTMRGLRGTVDSGTKAGKSLGRLVTWICRQRSKSSAMR